MKRASGFTLIELIVTITIMVLLMTLAVVNLRSSQANARDFERKSDAENLARGLELRYKQGNSKVIGYETKGSYPGDNEVLHAVDGWDWCPNKADVFSPCLVDGGYMVEWLPSTTKDAFYAPTASDQIAFHSTWGYGATSDDTTGRLNTINDNVAQDQYIYEPLDANGNNCYDSDCRRFNLYYFSEVEQQVHVIKSQNQ